MSNQKLIMEGWRDFLNKFTGGDFKKNLALWRSVGKNKLHFVLYMPSKFKNKLPIITDDHPPEVVGMVVMQLLDDPKKPCIPDTWQVKFIATAKKHQGKGIGSSLYEIAASYAKLISDGGITSDRDAGTSDMAKYQWDKIDTSSKYKKRTSKQGHDTFDYEKKTPDDPSDDCKLPPSMEDNAAEHSYEIVDASEDKINKYIRNHAKYVKISKVRDFDGVINRLSMEVFQKEFRAGLGL
jgi:GNAT superfamily N-acetyltransferase